MQIERNDSAALQAVLLKDGEAIEQIEKHLNSLPKAGLCREQLDSLGFALHNIYNALENSFSQISLTFENRVKGRFRWHRELLEKMFLPIPPLRPAVLPQAAKPILGDLLAFRHLFRRSYELVLDEEQLTALERRWQSESGLVKGALDSFAKRLAQISAGQKAS